MTPFTGQVSDHIQVLVGLAQRWLAERSQSLRSGCLDFTNVEGLNSGGVSWIHLFRARWPSSGRWPSILREKYGLAFSIARRLAGLLTVPGFLTTFGPVGMRSQFLMTIALRVMGNLITEEDSDAIARIWRTAGRASIKFDDRPPFS